MKERIMNQNLENFAKLRAPVRIGGKEKVVHRTATADDKKLPFCLKKLGGNTTSGIKEVTMFTNQGTGDPVGQSCREGMPVTDHADTEPLTETLPRLLKQLGAGGLTSSRRQAYALPTQPVDGKAPLAAGDQDDGDVPDHVQN